MNLGREALIARWAAASHQSTRLLETTAPLAVPPANLRTLADRELATPGRYHLSVKPPSPVEVPLWMRAWTWLQDRWAELWQATAGRTHLGRAGAVVIGDVLIGAVALLIVIVSFRLLTALVVERRARNASAEPLESAAEASTLYAGACERARRGEYVAASRLLFAAAVAALTGRALLQDDRSATVGDLRRTLQRRCAPLLPSFDVVSAAFVAGAYAERPVDASQWEFARLAYLALADHVIA